MSIRIYNDLVTTVNYLTIAIINVLNPIHCIAHQFNHVGCVRNNMYFSDSKL